MKYKIQLNDSFAVSTEKVLRVEIIHISYIFSFPFRNDHTSTRLSFKEL